MSAQKRWGVFPPPAAQGSSGDGAVPAPWPTTAGVPRQSTTMLTATLLLLGAVLVAMSLAESTVQRLPLSPATVYLLVGWAVGAWAQPMPAYAAWQHVPALVVWTELAVLISLFTVGLRLEVPPTWRAWRVAAVLASASMLVTIALATSAAMALLGLGMTSALLLATILAPTDPVLASEVQIQADGDRDAVRLSLTAEGGLNDSTALPVTMLALGGLGLHTLGDWGERWLLDDLVWPIAGGAALGWALGRSLDWAVRALLRRGHALAWDELLYLGSIALGYGLARATGTSAFLLVFVAGLVLFRPPASTRADDARRDRQVLERLVAFGHRCERLIEVSMVLLVGVALASTPVTPEVGLFALMLLVVIRPLSVILTVRRADLPTTQRRLVAWFGIRGVGSLFYLVFALSLGVQGPLASTLVSVTLWTIALSIVLHGISATPLMAWYQARRRGSRAQ